MEKECSTFAGGCSKRGSNSVPISKATQKTDWTERKKKKNKPTFDFYNCMMFLK